MKTLADILLRTAWHFIDATGIWFACWLFQVFQEMTFKHWLVVAFVFHSMVKSAEMLSEERKDVANQIS